MIPNKVVGSAIAIVVVGMASVIWYSVTNERSFLEMMALAQVLFTILAFAGVLYTLYYASGQFRKAMAKPLIKVAFNEEGEQQATLIYEDGELKNRIPHPWLINEGNAVARYFQIDFVIPENIGNPTVTKYIYERYISFVKDDGDYILSYNNDGRYTLFVNRPYSDPNMIFSAAIDIKKCIEVYKDSFEIKYRVYGDWAETQEGELKVICKKS